MDRQRLEDAWDVDEPPSDFAERVVTRSLQERRRTDAGRPRLRRWHAAAAVILAAAAAVLLFWRGPGAPSAGELAATERTELAVGRRATAVLEPGARVAWANDVVTQSRGDVFYRVEPGGPFRVETPAGSVTVLGTCFRVRVAPGTEKGPEQMSKRRDAAVAAGGAALAALAVITVYEGRVQLSHAGEKLELRAGESGRLSEAGAQRMTEDQLADAEAALARKGQPDFANANDRLASDIAELNRRIKGVEKEKGRLEAELEKAQTELAKATDSGAPRNRHDFDLDQQDWTELAKEGTVKFRHPCFRPNGWNPDQERLDQLGLSPDDATTLKEAYKRSYDRVWKTLRPLCAKAIGNPDVVDSLGPDTCTHVIADMARRQDGEAATEAQRQVSEVRAGLKPAAAAGTAEHPVYQMFWSLTGELGEFEKDLAQSFGPEEAHRLAYAKEICAGHSTFGGPGPRSK